VTPIRWSLAASIAAVVVLAACGAEVDSTSPVTPPALNVSPAAVTAVAGDTVRLRLTDDRGRPIRATVLGSSTAAATIDPTGLVTAVAPGTSVVTVTVRTGARDVTASVPVTVLGLSLGLQRAVVARGGSLTLRPTFVADSAAYGPLRWTSSDTTIAVVDGDGTVRGVGSGVARIAVVAGRDPRLRAEAEVTSLGCCGWESLTVQPSSVTLQPGGTEQITATVTLAPGAPAGISRGVLYSSSDTSVATVSAAGLITARRIGMAVVTVAMAASPAVTQAVAVTVRDVGRGRLTIQSVTTGDPPVPADLNAARGRLRVTINVPDDGWEVRRAELWLAGARAVALDSVPAPTGATGAGFRPLTFDVDTDARAPQTGLRLYPNGATTLEVRLALAAPGAPAGAATSWAIVPLMLTLANP
jgi:uncharacterized protein YjdB